jgi:hypothetical protein
MESNGDEELIKSGTQGIFDAHRLSVKISMPS